ncbi:uncharacterized protein DSM5745_07179 [Aspergillus mulundensis]|uniref:Uncharacterized protein n=1 Tax=Aspergillus mulundensis TaxID=1810919 RepID=A0A3D8RKD8_9EURO|nr:hypothetical protein DSM5745_07179 [Aspergillus mulundensis]RDW74517.1 hypothetical protein DSM5745_07179 [Aspergillus mulundensis]
MTSHRMPIDHVQGTETGKEPEEKPHALAMSNMQYLQTGPGDLFPHKGAAPEQVLEEPRKFSVPSAKKKRKSGQAPEGEGKSEGKVKGKERK